MRNRCVVCLSGGLDSAVLLAEAHRQGLNPCAIGFNYGSKHNRYENQSARELAEHYGVNFQLFDLSHVFGCTGKRTEEGSALLRGGPEVPEGHYQEESMRKTVVPGRNLIFLAIAASLAESIGAEQVMIAVHRGDHFIYPDCRPEFVNMAGATIIASTAQKVTLHAPFLSFDGQ